MTVVRLLQVCDEIRSDALLSVVLVLNGDDADVVIAQTVPHFVDSLGATSFTSVSSARLSALIQKSEG